MNEKQQNLYYSFAETVVKYIFGSEVDVDAYITPTYFFVVDDNGMEARSVWNETLTNSIQEHISSPLLLMEEQKEGEENKKYIILIQGKKDRYGILLTSSNGYQFICVKGVFNEGFTFERLLEEGADPLLENVFVAAKQVLADHPRYRLYATTGTLEFEEF